MSYLDICTNLLSSQFRRDREQIIARAREAAVTFIVTATDLAEAEQAIELCGEHDLRCTAGIHPHSAGAAEPAWERTLSRLLQAPAVCAVGETGLDFNRDFSPRTEQRTVFSAQIELARTHDKPLFVHDRDSNGEVLAMLSAALPLPPTTVHCFTGTEAELEGYIDAGFYIGITGWISDPERGRALRQLVRHIPLQQLLIETDAPYLRPYNAPDSFLREHGLSNRYKRRNEPALLPWVAQAVAMARGETLEVIEQATYANALRAFALG